MTDMTDITLNELKTIVSGTIRVPDFHSDPSIRAKRQYDLFKASAMNTLAPFPVWLILHLGGGLKRISACILAIGDYHVMLETGVTVPIGAIAAVDFS
jgi:hypothetical protein